jgi:hypothetical protein
MSNALSQHLGLEHTIDLTSYIGFPEYEQKAFEAPYILEIQLESEADLKKFVELTGAESMLEDGERSIKSCWYPPLANGERGSNALYVWVEVE